MMRTKYVNHYCPECAAIVDHVKLSYVHETVLVCMHCQHETLEGTVKKSFTLIMIDDKGYFTPVRRTVVVDLLCHIDPYMGAPARTETITVGYTAYAGEHFTASLTKYPGNGFIDHTDSKAIAKEIKKFIKEE